MFYYSNRDPTLRDTDAIQRQVVSKSNPWKYSVSLAHDKSFLFIKRLRMLRETGSLGSLRIRVSYVISGG